MQEKSAMRDFLAHLKEQGSGVPQGQGAVLQQKPTTETAGPGKAAPGQGTGGGQNQNLALGKDEYDKIEEVAKEVVKWVNEQGITTLIIENRSSKDLTFADDQKLTHGDQARWVKKAPSTIEAGKTDKIVVQTDMMIRGVKRGDTSGYAVYSVFGKDKNTTVRIAWSRKGDGGLDNKETWANGPFQIEGSQTNDGEFTYIFKDLAPPPKDPKADASKGSKGPAPAETFVLFALNDSKLDSKAESALHKFANAYETAQSTGTVYVSGYASVEGAETRNETLSFDRAKTVFEFLSTDGKVPGGKIQWEGFKTTDHFDPKNLPPNRRVTVSLTAPGAAPPPEPKEETKDPKAPVPQSKDDEAMPNTPRKPFAASRPGAT